jgi:hypothetical protein
VEAEAARVETEATRVEAEAARVEFEGVPDIHVVPSADPQDAIYESRGFRL